MGDLITIGGVHRKVDGYYVVVNGVYRKVQSTFEVVNGVYRKVYIAFDPHSIPVPITGAGSITYPYSGDTRTLIEISSSILQEARSALGVNCKLHIKGRLGLVRRDDGSGRWNNSFYCGSTKVWETYYDSYEHDTRATYIEGDYAFNENTNFTIYWLIGNALSTSASVITSADAYIEEAYFTV